MSLRTSEDEQSYYICGKCGIWNFYLKSEEPPIPCPTCAYAGKDKKYKDVPSEIKLDLTQL